MAYNGDCDYFKRTRVLRVNVGEKIDFSLTYSHAETITEVDMPYKTANQHTS